MTLKTPLFVVGLPVSVMAAWLLSLAIAVMTAHEVTLSVAGHDPRDLLSGHYLFYRIDYGDTPANDQKQAGRTWCACLAEGPDGVSKTTWMGECAARDIASCPLFIRGAASWRGFDAGIERYYIPERYQYTLATVPPKTTIKVRITKDGTAYVTGMYVDNIPILEWAEQEEERQASG